MELKIKNLVDTIDLNRSEAMLPVYESIVNSIISLTKSDIADKTIEVIIERDKAAEEPDLFGKQVSPIKTITIIDNGIGFTEENFDSPQIRNPIKKVVFEHKEAILLKSQDFMMVASVFSDTKSPYPTKRFEAIR